MEEQVGKAQVCDMASTLTQLIDLQKALSSLGDHWGSLNDDWAMGIHIDNDGVWLWANDGQEDYQERSIRELLKAIQASWREVYRQLPTAADGDYRVSDQRNNIKATLGELKRCLIKVSR